jgi:hypothetical protein
MMRVATKIKRQGVLVTASGNLLVVQFRKPHLVTLILVHRDGTKRMETLVGEAVPDLEDWEARADALWLKYERSKHGPVVRISMEDYRGSLYLKKLSYAV